MHNTCINRNSSLSVFHVRRQSMIRYSGCTRPRLLEDRPRCHVGSGSGQGRNRTRWVKNLSVVYPGDYAGERIDLDKIGFYDIIPRHMQVDLGDELDSDKEVEEEEDDGPLNDCLICGRRVRHNEPFCPYLDFVPHNAYLPPGIQRICKCCGNRDGHPGEKWKACAIFKECANCGTYAQHWTEDCPTNARKEQ